MEQSSSSFDEIVRGLLVYIKGQIPALQTRGKPEDLTRNLQNIVVFLRNSILQLEGASQFDPHQTREYKDLQKKLEAEKKTNQKFEESLFLEMGKNQKLLDEVERLRNLTKNGGDSETQHKLENQKLQEQISRKHEDLSELANEIERLKEENAELRKEIVRFKVEIHQRKEQKDVHLNEKLDLESDLRRVQDDNQVLTKSLEKAKKELNEFRIDFEGAHGEMPHLKNKVASLDETIVILRNAKKNLEKELEESHQGFRELKKRLTEQEGLFNSNEATVKSLEETVKRLREQLKSSPASEVIRNIHASYEAKINYLENSLKDSNSRIQEKEILLGQAPTKVEHLLKEKSQLEQRLIDLEAMVRRLASQRRKTGELGDQIEFGPEECLFFFEFFSTVIQRLEKNAEHSDLRFKSEEAMGLLLKSHAIEVIATTGTNFDGSLHKPIKAFFSSLLEDGTIINETVKGFRIKEHVIQRAHVWVVKSKFTCSACSTVGRPQDSFCPKCGFELTAPEGTPKRKLLSMPVNPDICIPLIDSFSKQGLLLRARDLAEYCLRDHPDDSDLLKRKKILMKKLQETEVN